MLIKILIGLAALVIAIIVIAALRPKDFHVARSATLSASPAAVFAHVNEPRAWQAWSPWEKLDPALKRTYEGPAAGVGASYAWAGNKEVGEGRLTVIESRPNELIRFRLEFIKPFAATNTAEFALQPAGDGRTTVTWSMSGQNNLLCRTVGLFMNMDKMIGTSFEQGLADLGKVAAQTPKS